MRSSSSFNNGNALSHLAFINSHLSASFLLLAPFLFLSWVSFTSESLFLPIRRLSVCLPLLFGFWWAAVIVCFSSGSFSFLVAFVSVGRAFSCGAWSSFVSGGVFILCVWVRFVVWSGFRMGLYVCVCLFVWGVLSSWFVWSRAPGSFLSV